MKKMRGDLPDGCLHPIEKSQFAFVAFVFGLGDESDKRTSKKKCNTDGDVIGRKRWGRLEEKESETKTHIKHENPRTSAVVWEKKKCQRKSVGGCGVQVNSLAGGVSTSMGIGALLVWTGGS